MSTNAKKTTKKLRTNKVTLLALLTAAIGVAGAQGCSAAPEDDASNDESALTRDERLGPALFRNDFYTYLKGAKKPDGTAYSDEDIQKLIYLPTDGVMKPKNIPATAAGPERLRSLDEWFKRIKPSDLYENGKSAPFELKADVEQALVDDPIHIVIVPGIFGEFIPRTPFDELFAEPSLMRTDWEKRGAKELAKCLDPRTGAPIPNAGAGPNDTIDGCDLRYNVKKLKDEWRPLSETTRDLVTGEMRQTGLIRVASIDGKGRDGKPTPLATVAYLKAGIGSLEDFGSLEDDNKVYLRRLDAYFKAIGQVPKNLYIMGYSRGTATGLDLVVRARRDVEHHAWAKNIKGFIAHAGVIYGSQLADASFTEGSPGTQTLSLLRSFVGEKDGEGDLASCEGATQEERANAEASLWLKSKNVVAYTKFGLDFAGTTLRNMDFTNPGHRDELNAEGIDTSLPNVSRFSVFAGRVLGIPIRSSGLEPSELEGVVSLEDANIAYCRNVEAFKTTARAIIVGAETLTTKARADWWSQKENALPSDVRYFALTGTMGDPGNKELATNPVAYDPASVDFRSLRGNYYDLLDASGNQLQDSQVPVQRGRFWPELHNGSSAFLAGGQRLPIKTYFMGTVGTHHWGLGFPRAFSSHDGLDANPFPRTILLKSIATFVAQVAQAERR